MSTSGSHWQSVLGSAIAHHQAGRLAQAAELYQQIIAREPGNADALRLLGVVAYQVGKHASAVELLRQAIRINGGIAEYHNDLGLALQGLGRVEEAAGALREALRIKPEMAEAHYNLGNALRGLGRVEEAISCYQRALQIQAAYPEALNNLGNAHKDRDEFEEAVGAYRAALALRPDFADTLNNLGHALRMISSRRRHSSAGAQGGEELQQAVEAYREALRLKPDDPQTLTQLGMALAALGRKESAMESYRTALRVRPGFPEALFNVGNLLLEEDQAQEAAMAYRAALAGRPEYPEALVHLGNALRKLRQLDGAMEAYRAATALRPDLAEAHNNLGSALKDAGRTDEAVAAFRLAIEHRGNYAEAWHNLGVALTGQGRMSEALGAYRRAVELEPGNVAMHNHLIYALHFDPAYEPRAVAAELAVWNERHARPVAKLAEPLEVRDGGGGGENRALRVGLVSPDFRRHPIGRFLLPLLEAHDKTECELFCYSDVKTAAHDSLTGRLRSLADRWHNTANLTDREVAGLVRLDCVDILVDLTMHMEGSRLLVFAEKPAPVQVTYLAYPTSTGMTGMDYRLTDEAFEGGNGAAGAEGGGRRGRGADPGVYTEKPLLLKSYWCYPEPEGAPEVARLPARSAGHVTFACLNNFSKVSPQALGLWTEILRAVPDSRLFLHAASGSHREAVRRKVAAAGIDPGRCEFFGFLPFGDYLALHRRIDLALDPFPYAGGTTTCDAIYMGVPIVTLAGPWALSRGGVSVLTAIGLRELIAESMEAYVRLAVGLAKDWPRLESLRAGLRERMRASPLMDGRGFARDFQAAMRRAWRMRRGATSADQG